MGAKLWGESHVSMCLLCGCNCYTNARILRGQSVFTKCRLFIEGGGPS